MIIIFFLIDSLLNTNSIILSIYQINKKTFYYDSIYYLKLALLGMLMDIIYTQVILNTFLIPLIGYILIKINNRYRGEIIINILLLAIYRILLYLTALILYKKQINVYSTLLKTMPLIFILNTKYIYKNIRYYIKSPFPKNIVIKKKIC